MRAMIVFAGLISFGAWAAEESTISLHAPASAMVSSTNNFTEIGMEYSSINDGTPYATAALIHEFENGFSLGARGGLPLQFRSNANSYVMQVVGRLMLMNTLNQLYLEPTLSEVFFNGNGSAKYFGMLGLNYGYNRVIAKDIVVGAHIGVDYGMARVTGDEYDSTARTLYSKIGLAGSYYF